MSKRVPTDSMLSANINLGGTLSMQSNSSAVKKAGEMLGRPLGIILLAAALLAAGLVGIAAFCAVWPRTSNTSPLAALCALVWSCTYVVTALLTWRRSRLGAPAFLAAMGLLLPLLWFIFPGGHVLQLPAFAGTFLFGLLGYRYLRKTQSKL